MTNETLNAVCESPAPEKVKKAPVENSLRGIYTVICTALGLALTAILIFNIVLNAGNPGKKVFVTSGDAAIMDRLDMYVTNQVSSALDGVLSIEKVYWLSDSDLVAPEPNQELFGETYEIQDMKGFLKDAQELLDGQSTLFNTDIEIMPTSKIRYYLDETIMVITWKQVMNNCVYTISEVKIAHPSQFRRFLAGGQYGSDKQFPTTEMAASVNAVVASSGDFYKYRQLGTIVYEGKVQRINSELVDTLFIDDKGNLIMVRGGEMTQLDEAQKFVDDNNIRFSVAFGPILIEDGVRCEPYSYVLGEINDHYPRAAIGQRDDLHYVLVTANDEAFYADTPTLHTFAANMETMGCHTVYTLDGGQTAVIAMNDKLINAVLFGYQRHISDIIYFATALPDGE